MSGLTNKQKLFVEEYLKDFNATRAAERAGYNGDDNTLAAIGSQNLRKLNIAKKISARLQESAMSADEVLRRLAEQARGEIGDFISINEKTGDFKIDWKAAKDKTHLIKSLKHTAHGVTIELYDAQSALSLIGKHYALFVDRAQQMNVDLTKLTNEQLDRLAGGEDVYSVLTNAGESGDRETPERDGS